MLQKSDERDIATSVWNEGKQVGSALRFELVIIIK